MKHIRTYSGIILLCTIVLFVTACANPEIPPEATATPAPSVAVRPEQTTTPEPTATSTPAPTVTVVPTLTQAPIPPTPVPGLSEAELLEQLISAAGVAPESYRYADFDHNGTNELFAAFAVDYLYQVWYCNSDGTVCEKAYESYGYFDACEMTDIENAAINETHIVINLYNMMGTNKQFSILALRDTGVVCLVPWNYGTAGTDANGQPCMTVEAYDGSYDAASEMWLMHTWKQTWLSYDKDANTYKEISAKKINEEEFLKFTNAAECLEQIRTQETKADTADISFEYFCRSNGVLHVQCFVTDTSGNIAARYYTLTYENGVIIGAPELPTDGIMQERLSGLEAVE